MSPTQITGGQEAERQPKLHQLNNLDGMNFSYRAAQKAGVIDNNTSVEEFYKNAKEGNGSVTYNGQTIYYKAKGNNQYQVTTAK